MFLKGFVTNLSWWKTDMHVWEITSIMVLFCSHENITYSFEKLKGRTKCLKRELVKVLVCTPAKVYIYGKNLVVKNDTVY